MTWRVTAVRNGREWHSWHATEAEAKAAAKDQRKRRLFSRVTVSLDPQGAVRELLAGQHGNNHEIR